MARTIAAPDARSSLAFLYGLQLFGIKAGLRNIRALLKFLGNPEEGFPSVHIAGTNGKGSTAAMIASVLAASGYRTGLYTSPHLRSFAERIRINGRPIPRADIVRYTEAMRPAILKTRATFFEATTAMAFAYFADNGVDVAVVETGLGGRLDATNVLEPRLSIITGIGLDHTEHLGATIPDIAFEKAGIIKPHVPVIAGPLDRSAMEVVARRARQLRAPLVHVGLPPAGSVQHESLEGVRLSLQHELAQDSTLFVAMAGAHQARNARVALSALAELRSRARFGRITPSSAARGFASIRRYSGLRGRIDLLRRTPPIVADVGHNPDGIATLASALRRLVVGRMVVVFGVMKDKDYRAMVRELAPVVRAAVAVQPKTERALDAGSIVGAFQAEGRRAVAGGSVRRGLAVAMDELRPGETLLVAGSHYVVGEAMDALGVR